MENETLLELSSPAQADFTSPTLFSAFHPELALLFILPLTLFLAHSIRKDYHAFLALGPGGTPSTPAGYLRICLLRLVTIRDPFAPPSLPSVLHPQQGFLQRNALSIRRGPRPKVVGIAPQRQVTQKPGAAMYDALSAEIHRLARQHPEALYTATSCFEKHSTGIFCRLSNPTMSTNPCNSETCKQPRPSQNLNLRVTCNGEVCHSHPSDGSLHLTLHPADVKLVLERGWAQRHPLARESWWWRRIVPTGFVMIYAPRDAEELKCVVEIIRAAAWWVSGKELQ
ncbi:hypothetical protein ARAM_004875 [Aspergillus rambellii]|uniref:Luciferase domain-containing protein n=2 Tax=Aspergillus subgen. Nidulantes TaxID=2720870 RepID=A0A0F8UL26_9EURO|nr:hypothetical protein ARAM_004875 [Aspergillus rambellii]